MTYQVLVMKTRDGGFSAAVPALPGWLTVGCNENEVLDRARGAIGQAAARSGGPSPDIVLVRRAILAG